MYNALSSIDEVFICANITLTSGSDFYHKAENGVKHYYIPSKEAHAVSNPSKKTIDYVVNAILENNPDLIHVWGMELNWGIMMGDRRLLHIKKLLEIQGIKSVYAESQYYMGGLGRSEILEMRSALQAILPIKRVESQQKSYKKWRAKEKQILSNIPNINTQSEWVRIVIPSMFDNLQLKTFETGIILRSGFMETSPWFSVHKREDHPAIFTTTSSLPYKALHVTIKAFKLIKRNYPSAILYVAGMTKWNPNLIKGGYSKYIYSLINELSLEDSVVFMGNLTEKEMLEQMYKADVFVMSSFVETYCLALAEALALGIPTVSSNSTALKELVRDGENGLAYPTGDHYLCAQKIMTLLKDSALSYKLSEAASTSYRKEKSKEKAVEKQLATYRELLG